MRALGMIETKGLLAGIVAADTMLKTAQVTLLAKEQVGGGLVTVIVTGDVASAEAAVEAAKAAVVPFDCLVSAHVIARPIEELEALTDPIGRQGGTAKPYHAADRQPERKKPLKEETEPKQTKKKEQRLWDRTYLESLKVVELRSIAREQKDTNISGVQIRNGKKEELIAFILKAQG